MKKKEVNYYFQTFIKLFEYSRESIKYLGKVVNNFENGITDQQKDEIHQIEHAADLCLDEALSKLAKEFITPIANEDILAIIKKIDDATDAIEDVAIKMYIYNVKELPDVSKQFVDIIKRECDALADVLEEFVNFKKSKSIKDKIREVLSIEEEGDRLYISSIKELFSNPQDFQKVYVTEILISAFEKCCDTIEEIAQVIDEAIMKNS